MEMLETGAPAAERSRATSGSASGGGVWRRVRRGVVAGVDVQKNSAADGLAGVADSVSRVSADLRAENELLASWVEGAARRLRGAASGLRERPASDLADHIAGFARRRPVLFVAAAFVLGLGLARALQPGSDR